MTESEMLDALDRFSFLCDEYNRAYREGATEAELRPMAQDAENAYSRLMAVLEGMEVPL